MDNNMISQFNDVRNRTIAFVKGMNSDIAHIVPDGFNNNILWNVGHIIVACDHWIFPKLKQIHRVTHHYHLIFRKGTSPKTWEVDPPNIHELIDVLKKQLVEITDACLGNLDKKLPAFVRKSLFFEGA
ncbi:DinB family protein [Paenibacillus sedimenti]|uniref:DinB family protein n=1 Tax=Paenibacillus sedimenti TaxID=2770274 RepID=A0A926KJL0_9BACL|nr:DinB family protein [Paenibacillus sedimenti]MBD0378934.1 DinB family protein [Paenibacillus sedimenti]